MKPVLVADSLTRNVRTSTEQLTILDSVSLSLEAGESLAIKGASGSGKSTLLSLLAGLDLPQGGRVALNNVELNQLNEDQRADLRADKVGFVFQSFHLVDDLTALENVALPLELFGHKNAFKTAGVWLKKLGLFERASHHPKQLSGGEQQRVALCRAFAIEPEFLFADEPTANLDAATAQTVLDQLFALQHDAKTSMVIATHDTQLAERCDRVIELRSGRLIAGDENE